MILTGDKAHEAAFNDCFLLYMLKDLLKKIKISPKQNKRRKVFNIQFLKVNPIKAGIFADSAPPP